MGGVDLPSFQKATLAPLSILSSLVGGHYMQPTLKEYEVTHIYINYGIQT